MKAGERSYWIVRAWPKTRNPGSGAYTHTEQFLALEDAVHYANRLVTTGDYSIDLYEARKVELTFDDAGGWSVA